VNLQFGAGRILFLTALLIHPTDRDLEFFLIRIRATFLGAESEQKPDITFKGTRTVVAFGVATGEHTAVNVRCDPKDFSAVFEIPLALVRPAATQDMKVKEEIERLSIEVGCAGVNNSP